MWYSLPFKRCNSRITWKGIPLRRLMFIIAAVIVVWFIQASIKRREKQHNTCMRITFRLTQDKLCKIWYGNYNKGSYVYTHPKILLIPEHYSSLLQSLKVHNNMILKWLILRGVQITVHPLDALVRFSLCELSILFLYTSRSC